MNCGDGNKTTCAHSPTFVSMASALPLSSTSETSSGTATKGTPVNKNGIPTSMQQLIYEASSCDVHVRVLTWKHGLVILQEGAAQVTHTFIFCFFAYVHPCVILGAVVVHVVTHCLWCVWWTGGCEESLLVIAHQSDCYNF